MVGPIVKCELDIDDREASEHTAADRVLQTLVDRRNVFARHHAALDFVQELEAFASFNGPDWYGLPRNSGKITLVKQDWTVPAEYPYISTDSIVPLRAGETLSWKKL